MRAIGRILLINFICIFMAGFFSSQMAAVAKSADKKENVKIHWAFGALTGPGSNRELLRIEKDTTLKTGDQFKMMVELKSMCFVYLIYHGSSGEIQLLFPNTLKQFNTNYHIAQKYYIPQRDLWFALDEHNGRETFYLLISKTRLSKLEDLLQKYQSSGLAKKSEVVLEIIDQVKQIRKQHLSLSAKAERPLSIGGSVRGVQKQSTSLHDIAALSVEISATDFYGRTFTIEHE
jgi:hypothetical protein